MMLPRNLRATVVNFFLFFVIKVTQGNANILIESFTRIIDDSITGELRKHKNNNSTLIREQKQAICSVVYQGGGSTGR